MIPKLESLLVGREKEQTYLINLLRENQPLSKCIVLSGPPGCGKSLLVSSTFKVLEQSFGLKWVLISCLDYSKGQGYGSVNASRYFFELILQSIKCKYLLKDYILSTNCEGAMCFLSNLCNLLEFLANIDPDKRVSFGIVFDRAERLRDSDTFLLPLLLRLGELVDDQLLRTSDFKQTPNLFTMFVTRSPWDKFNSGTLYFEPTVMCLFSYSRDQMKQLLVSVAPNHGSSARFSRFIDLLLTVCYPVCRNVRELIYIMNINWPAFEDPVIKGLVAPDDEWGQWKYAQPVLRRSLASLYLRPSHDMLESCKLGPARPQYLELPYFTKFLLIAAYMASYNHRSADKKFLVKNTGKLSTRRKRKEKEVGGTQTQLTGPQIFPLQRLLAIFFAIIQNESMKLSLTTLLTSQIACLTALGLLASTSPSMNDQSGRIDSFVGKTSNLDVDSLSNPKYRCLVNLETAKAVAHSVDFDLLSHLTDFCGAS